MNSILIIAGRKVAIGAFAIVTSVLFLTYCGANLYKPADDAKLGKEVAQEIDSNPQEYPILNNPTVTAYVQSIVNDILRSPKIKYRGVFAYRVKVIHDDNTVNAFCTPGGYIYVYTGLMRIMDNEASLAGVLGHEIAHAENRHSTERITKAYGIQMLASVVLGQNPSQAATIASNLFSGLELLRNSRSDELESDNSSFEYLRSTKWYPGAIKYFFQKTSGRNTSAFETLFLTHPPSEDRLSNINDLTRKNKIPAASESNLFATRYKQKLALLPPAQSKKGG